LNTKLLDDDVGSRKNEDKILIPIQVV